MKGFIDIACYDFQVTHRTLAAQLCGIFVSVEKEAFESRLPEILPLVLKQFHAEDAEAQTDEPGRFVKLQKPKSKTKKKSRRPAEPDIKDPERMKDHHLFQVLQLSLKIASNCPTIFKNDKYEDSVRSLAGSYNYEFLSSTNLPIYPNICIVSFILQLFYLFQSTASRCSAIRTCGFV